MADDGTTARFVAMVLVVVGALYGITILADFYGFQYFAGKFSLGLFLVGSIWCVGFLLLRTDNQAATESYDLERAKLRALHPEADTGSTTPLHDVARRYDELARRHEAITRVRSYSAALTLYATAFAGIAAATVLVGIGGFWGLFDFFAVVLLVGALVVHVLGPYDRGLTRPLQGLLPARWQ
jgi:hypothetical protein